VHARAGGLGGPRRGDATRRAGRLQGAANTLGLPGHRPSGRPSRKPAFGVAGACSGPTTTARLFNPASYPQGDINFLFGTTIEPGQSSQFFFLHTDAGMFAMTADDDFVTGADGIGGAGPTHAPAVPEPAPAALLALGVPTLAGLRSRRGRQG